MTAVVYILPVVRRVHFEDPAWREQQLRENWARVMDEMAPPQRTRPLLVTRTAADRTAEHRSFMERAIARAAAEDRQLIVGSRPGPEKPNS